MFILVELLKIPIENHIYLQNLPNLSRLFYGVFKICDKLIVFKIFYCTTHLWKHENSSVNLSSSLCHMPSLMETDGSLLKIA